MEERIETMENTELTEVYEFEPEEGEGSGIVGKVVVGVVLGGVAGAIALAVANRDKIKAKLNERKAAKLEKAGYVVLRPEEDEVVAEVDPEDIDE